MALPVLSDLWRLLSCQNMFSAEWNFKSQSVKIQVQIMKSLDDGVEIVSGDIQTDSYGSRSDASGGKFVSSPSRPKMEVVCVIDLHSHHFLSDRKRAFEDVKHACAAMNNVALTHIQVRTWIYH